MDDFLPWVVLVALAIAYAAACVDVPEQPVAPIIRPGEYVQSCRQLDTKSWMRCVHSTGKVDMPGKTAVR